MKVSGPRSKPVAALTSEPKKESAPGARPQVKPVALGSIRDGFEARPPTRGPNIRLGSGNADNITRGPRGGGAPGLEAGSSLTLLPRLRDLFQGRPGGPGAVETQGSRVRIGSGHSDLVTMGDGPGRRDGRDSGIGSGRAGRVTADGTAREPVLKREDLEGLDLSGRMVRKLAKAKSIDKVAQIIRRLPSDMQERILMLCRGPVRPGASNADNLQP